jgi:tetratricopeptide (TPR) repeat protein
MGAGASTGSASDGQPLLPQSGPSFDGICPSPVKADTKAQSQSWTKMIMQPAVRPVKSPAVALETGAEGEAGKKPEANYNAACATDFSLLGVKFSAVKLFIQHCGGEECLLGKTTKDICNLYLKPTTSKSGLSLCDQLLCEGRADLVARADWFISHAWDYNFLHVIEAISCFLENEYGPTKKQDVVIWFDMFSNSQHNTSNRNFDWWRGTFTNAVRQLGNVLMVLLPWDNPLTLTRAWCTFEVYACVTTGSRFEVSMTRSEQDRFAKMIGQDAKNVFFGMLSTIKSENSEAFYASDKAQIDDAIRRLLPKGFVELDSMVFRVMERWMISTLTRQLETETDTKRIANVSYDLCELLISQGKFTQAVVIVSTCQLMHEAAYGLEDLKCILSVRLGADLCRLQGNTVKAQEMYLNCLRRMEDNVDSIGPTHIETINTAFNLADCYKSIGHLELSEQLYLRCMAAYENELGPDHSNTLSCMIGLAEVYAHSKSIPDKLVAAEALSDTCLVRCEKNLGDDHPITLICRNNLASCCYSQGKFDAALVQYVKCANSSARVRGSDHPDTLIAESNLAQTYRAVNNFIDAEPIYRSVLERCATKLGPNHSQTIAQMNNLASCLSAQRKYNEAENLFISCLVLSNQHLGSVHTQTIQTTANLAMMYVSKADYLSAKLHLSVCVNLAQQVGDPSMELYQQHLAQLNAMESL